jgi:hypothetical protein
MNQQQLARAMYEAASEIWLQAFKEALRPLLPVVEDPTAPRLVTNEQFITDQFRSAVYPRDAARAYASELLHIASDKVEETDETVHEVITALWEEHFKLAVVLAYPNIVKNDDNRMRFEFIEELQKSGHSPAEAAQIYIDTDYPQWRADPGEPDPMVDMASFYYNLWPGLGENLARRIKHVLVGERVGAMVKNLHTADQT